MASEIALELTVESIGLNFQNWRLLSLLYLEFVNLTPSTVLAEVVDGVVYGV